MGSSYTLDYRDVHVSLSPSHMVYTDIQTLDPTQTIGGRDRSRESSEIERDDCHPQRGKFISSILWVYADV
jgi:hypothetical protein